MSEDIEWKLIYVGSAESDEHDQELDSILVGPMQASAYKIVFQADPPDPRRIPAQDLLGVTVISSHLPIIHVRLRSLSYPTRINR
mmetsp:Transcript_25248/g.76608  ORF Transcript_25248/g.76608 Transcript_25248/m.76608 type:complete len:85 (-) Transcript_25248:496-750(-)